MDGVSGFVDSGGADAKKPRGDTSMTYGAHVGITQVTPTKAPMGTATKASRLERAGH